MTRVPEIRTSPIEVNRNIMELEYAVRGPIPQRAAELKRQGRSVISCNIGNPQALGQPPLSFYRQVLSLMEDPAKIARERQLKNYFSASPSNPALNSADFISDYVLDLCDRFLSRLENGLGAYSESNGPLFIRTAVADFITKRDGFDSSPNLKSNPRDIFITNGASEAVKYVIDLLIARKNDGIMIPIPQYPLYSATIKKAGGVQVNYYLDEDSGWTLKRSELEASITTAQKNGVNVKGIVVINPGNPTGAILDEATIMDVINFAQQHNLVIIADEVYQENVYGAPFYSFAKALLDRPVTLFSLHSVSKGFSGECGHRGGYLEVRNAPKISGTDMSFTDVLLKQASVSLCSNTVGQLLVYLMVNPPEEGSEVYDQFVQEKQSILNELIEKATMLRDGFQYMDSMQCFGRTGALYLFPRIGKLPPETTDYDYCMSLLEETGLCTVNGSGFGQKEGTHHLRIAFLPPKGVIEKVLPEWIRFHNEYVNRK
jgi:aspartate/methionine/tyrosine aminotransferase